MTQTGSFLRRLLATFLEGRRAAAQRRVEAYLDAIGIGEPPHRR